MVDFWFWGGRECGYGYETAADSSQPGGFFQRHHCSTSAQHRYHCLSLTRSLHPPPQALTTLPKLGRCSTVCTDPSIPLYPVISAHNLIYKCYSHYREEHIIWSTFLNVAFILHWTHFEKIETKDFVSYLHTCHLHFV